MVCWMPAGSKAETEDRLGALLQGRTILTRAAALSALLVKSRQLLDLQVPELDA